MIEPVQIQINETLSQRIFRLTIGVLMCILTGVAYLMAAIAWLIPFVGGLAFLAGAGGASENQITNGFLMILLMTLSPYIWSVLLTGVSVYILRRKKPKAIFIMCTISLLLYLTLAQATLRGDWTQWYTIATAIPALILAGGLVVAYQMRPMGDTAPQ